MANFSRGVQALSGNTASLRSMIAGGKSVLGGVTFFGGTGRVFLDSHHEPDGQVGSAGELHSGERVIPCRLFPALAHQGETKRTAWMPTALIAGDDVSPLADIFLCPP